jgi:GNAT superfamily N-acetyltransferase
MDARVRLAVPGDATVAARLLHDFNAEFAEPTPAPDVIAERLGPILAEDDWTHVLLGGEPPVGIAVLRLRRSILDAGQTAYLEELYVAPEHRGHGLGRAILESTIELARDRGAVWIEVSTSEDDEAARALYESVGFINREGGPDGPIVYMYEREL